MATSPNLDKACGHGRGGEGSILVPRAYDLLVSGWIVGPCEPGEALVTPGCREFPCSTPVLTLLTI